MQARSFGDGGRASSKAFARPADRSALIGSIRRSRRLGLVLTITFACATVTTASGLAHAQPPARVAASQRLVEVLAPHELFSAPSPHAARLGLLRSERPLTGERTALPLLAERLGSGGVEWLHVRLPGRPNGHTGWIEQAATRLAQTRWHIMVDTSTRRVTVYYAGRVARRFEAIVGAPSTPTPHGTFFVEEAVELAAGEPGAPFALALSARSDALRHFDGGPGQIALHGLDNVGGELGTAESHGCVRLADATMRWLITRIGPGVPVTISA